MSKSNWHRTSKQSRGYGAAWERVRKQVLERDRYLCQCRHCKAEGRTTLATEVDHVISKAKAKRMGWTQKQIDDPGNLGSIGRECHKRKTIEEQGATYKPKVRIGLDGWPIPGGR